MQGRGGYIPKAVLQIFFGSAQPSLNCCAYACCSLMNFGAPQTLVLPVVRPLMCYACWWPCPRHKNNRAVLPHSESAGDGTIPIQPCCCAQPPATGGGGGGISVGKISAPRSFGALCTVGGTTVLGIHSGYTTKYFVIPTGCTQDIHKGGGEWGSTPAYRLILTCNTLAPVPLNRKVQLPTQGARNGLDRAKNLSEKRNFPLRKCPFLRMAT